MNISMTFGQIFIMGTLVQQQGLMRIPFINLLNLVGQVLERQMMATS